MNRKMAEYEARIALLSQENERINGLSKSKADELINTEARLRALHE